MLDWLKRLLCKGEQKQEKPELPTIAPGERWLLCPSNGDPWGQKPYRPVTILDVRNGWVRYDMGPGPFRDERKKIGEFVGMYKLVTPNQVLTEQIPQDQADAMPTEKSLSRKDGAQ